MPTSTNVTNLKINELTEAQYDTAVQGGVIGVNELSVITDLDDAIQVSTMPTAGADEVGKVYQFIGTTDASYTHGYFYECVSDGQTPATYSWTRVDVQPGSSLPSQTGNSGKFLTTDGTDASWSDKVLINQNRENTTGVILVRPDAPSNLLNISNYCNYLVGIGYSISIGYAARKSVVIGYGARLGGSSTLTSEIVTDCIAIGYQAIVSKGGTSSNSISGAMQFGKGTNSENGTVCFGLTTDGTNYANYKLLDSDGTIPTDRFTTTPSVAGTYTCTITVDAQGNVTRSWAQASGGSTSATATLAVADWSSNTQTVNVTGVTASNNVMVAPAPASTTDYTSAGIICTAQGAGTLTFTCTTVPSNAITVNVLILN